MSDKLYTTIYFMLACNQKLIFPRITKDKAFEEFRNIHKDNKLDLEQLAYLQLSLYTMYAFLLSDRYNLNLIDLLNIDYGLTQEEQYRVAKEISKIFKSYESKNEH